MKRIGILTSGGDSQGMNNAIRAVTRTAIANGMTVMGIRNGYQGLIDGDIEELHLRSVSNILDRGGTFLQTARCLEFKEEAGVLKAVKTCKDFGIEGLVVIGGDGSFRGARDMTLHGIPTVAMPGTIDNDIACSEYTIGFDTAVNVAMEAADKLRDTSASHHRCSVIEVMGRNAGWVAVDVGISAGATYTLVPEVSFTMEDVINKIKIGESVGKKNFMIVASEGLFVDSKKNKNYEYLARLGLTSASKFAKALEELTGVESRATILGHIQRGGSPTARDRYIATEMGCRCTELLKEGKSNRVVAIKDNKIIDLDIVEALEMTKEFDLERYNLANKIGI
ncbi:MAG: 6-phosphofructokinase [Clostridia bacterium]|nr:6-phosphofructokinase [Clostridia bacterium]